MGSVAMLAQVILVKPKVQVCTFDVLPAAIAAGAAATAATEVLALMDFLFLLTPNAQATALAAPWAAAAAGPGAAQAAFPTPAVSDSNVLAAAIAMALLPAAVVPAAGAAVATAWTAATPIGLAVCRFATAGVRRLQTCAAGAAGALC